LVFPARAIRFLCGTKSLNRKFVELYFSGTRGFCGAAVWVAGFAIGVLPGKPPLGLPLVNSCWVPPAFRTVMGVVGPFGGGVLVVPAADAFGSKIESTAIEAIAKAIK
jgi:hypothetical protein